MTNAVGADHGSAGVLVTAVLVTAGVTEYLRRTLTSLAQSSRRPDLTIVVDVGGPEGVGALAAEILPGEVRSVGVLAGSFGEAVTRGIEQVHEPSRWLWLLHDDSAPGPDALYELVRAVGHAPSVVVAGSKQRTWDDPELILEVGSRTTRWGRRWVDVEPNEIDQGQYDGISDVLAVGTAGVLVRRDIWQKLGGTDAAVGPFGDGLELSLRARLAGHRVIVVPSAVVRHAQAARRGLRSGSGPATAAQALAARRRSESHLGLVWTPWWLFPLAVLILLLAGPIRAAGRALVGQTTLAPSEFASWSALSRPRAVIDARRRVARTAVLPRRTLWPLQVGWREVLNTWGFHQEAADEPIASQAETDAWRALTRRRRAGLIILLGSLIGIGLVANSGLLIGIAGGGNLAGGALALIPSDWDLVWSQSVSDWVSAGFGEPGPADPLLRVLAIGSIPFGGSVRWLVVAIVTAGGVAASWSAWVAAGAATRSVVIRGWVAALWATSPVLLAAVSSGRLGAVVSVIFMPWVAYGITRWLDVQRADHVRTGLDVEPTFTRTKRFALPTRTWFAGAAMALAIVWAGSPSLLLPGLLVLVALAAHIRKRQVLAIAVPGLILLGPILVEAATRGFAGWKLLVTDPGLPHPEEPADPLLRLFGVPVMGFDLLGPRMVPDSWVVWAVAAPGIVVLALALAALLRVRAAGGTARVGWVIAVIGLVAATVMAAIPGQENGEVFGSPFLGPSLALAESGFLIAAIVGADGMTGRLAGHVFGWRQMLSGTAAVFAWVGVAMGMLSWVVPNRPWDIAVVHGSLVPAVGQQFFAAPAGSRVLAIEPGSPVAYQVLSADGTYVTQSGAAVTSAQMGSHRDLADREVAAAVATLSAGSAEDEAGALGALGIGAVLLPPLDGEATGVSPESIAWVELEALLDGTPGLERVTDGPQGTLWRVSTEKPGVITSWARLVPTTIDLESDEIATIATALPGDGQMLKATIDPTLTDRYIVLAERSSGYWKADVNGEDLTAVDIGWRQGFLLPGGVGGELKVVGNHLESSVWLIGQATVALAWLIWAIPVRRRQEAVL